MRNWENNPVPTDDNIFYRGIALAEAAVRPRGMVSLLISSFDIHIPSVYSGIIMSKVVTRKRVNITLPKDTINLIDQVAEKGNRSRFLDEAVRFYVKETGRANLRKLLQEGATQRAERDLNLTREWFHLEREAWQKGKRK